MAVVVLVSFEFEVESFVEVFDPTATLLLVTLLGTVVFAVVFATALVAFDLPTVFEVAFGDADGVFLVRGALFVAAVVAARFEVLFFTGVSTAVPAAVPVVVVEARDGDFTRVAPAPNVARLVGLAVVLFFTALVLPDDVVFALRL